MITPITNPDTHLEMYLILPTEPGTTRYVDVSNQFGIQTLTVQDPVLLGVPTQKVPFGPPHDVDHFKLYNATGNALNVTVDLRDQFHQELGVPVLQPRYFGNPVEKTHNGNVTPIVNPADFLVCYDIAPQSFNFNIQTINQIAINAKTTYFTTCMKDRGSICFAILRDTSVSCLLRAAPAPRIRWRRPA